MKRLLSFFPLILLITLGCNSPEKRDNQPKLNHPIVGKWITYRCDFNDGSPSTEFKQFEFTDQSVHVDFNIDNLHSKMESFELRGDTIYEAQGQHFYVIRELQAESMILDMYIPGMRNIATNELTKQPLTKYYLRRVNKFPNTK